MPQFTPIPSLLGGLLIGGAASLLLLGGGRIAGVSGVMGSTIDDPRSVDGGWRRTFLLGLVLSGLAGLAVSPEAVGDSHASTPLLVLSGLLVGFGTRLGDGCTSGHGVCGTARGSARSWLATCVFMLTGGLTVFAVRHVFGGLR
ncbi:MAG: YeeE/YedE family protein [Myxococcales bacterium]|nr:YeeE/YedE family protein [Myxococcales bacterium]